MLFEKLKIRDSFLEMEATGIRNMMSDLFGDIPTELSRIGCNYNVDSRYRNKGGEATVSGLNLVALPPSVNMEKSPSVLQD